MSVIRQNSKRDDDKDKKIKDALNRKPTNLMAKRQGITIEQLNDSLSRKHTSMPGMRKVVNSKNVKRRKRPENITRPIVSLAKTINTLKSSYFPVPSWFNNHKKVDVSIIVPMYRSKSEIVEQIKSWDLTNDGLTKEIIYVNDACPENSYENIVPTWNFRKKEIKGSVGKIVMMSANSGYGQACNAGANCSSGEYLLFLNADCTVTPNWLRPMYEAFQYEPKIGIVGNLQLRDDGTIDSAGSEWCWSGGHFPHIGRNIHNRKNLNKPYKWSSCPLDLKTAGPREMVTGCCFMIPRNIFMDIEGFDPSYKVGYWEDSDLNMKVATEGYKIYFEPKSKIYHKSGHSKAGAHQYKNHNRELFKKRWVDTGRIDKLINIPRANVSRNIKNSINGEVVGCVIACNEEEFLEASVESVSPFVSRFVFVIGGNEYAYKAEMCDRKGYPTDNTLEIAKTLAKKYNGVVIEPPGRLWKNKVEMRNAYTPHLNPDNWMLILDGDEVYKERQLWRLTELMKEYRVINLQYWPFWNDVNTIGTGIWDKYPAERIVKWGRGFHYRNSNHLSVSDIDGVLVKDRYNVWTGSERLFYHYSWIRPIEKIIQKRSYYKYQSNITSDNYVNDVFLKWRTNPADVRETHPKGGGGAETFPGTHPKQVQRLIDKGKLNF